MLRGELRQADVADLVLRVDDVVPGVVVVALDAQDRLDLDPAADELELERLVLALALDDELDLGALGLPRIFLTASLGGHALGGDDLRAGRAACPRCPPRG